MGERNDGMNEDQDKSHGSRFKHLPYAFSDPSRSIIHATVDAGVECRLMRRFMANRRGDRGTSTTVMRHHAITIATVKPGYTADVDVQLLKG